MAHEMVAFLDLLRSGDVACQDCGSVVVRVMTRVHARHHGAVMWRVETATGQILEQGNL